MGFRGQGVLSDVEAVAAKVDEQAVLDAGGFQIADYLRHMLINDGFDGFEFDDEAVFDKEIGKVLADDGSIFVVNRDGMLLFHVEAELPKPVSEGVLINLLQMAVSMVLMDGVSRFADQVTQLKDRSHDDLGSQVLRTSKALLHFFAISALFCG